MYFLDLHQSDFVCANIKRWKRRNCRGAAVPPFAGGGFLKALDCLENLEALDYLEVLEAIEALDYLENLEDLEDLEDLEALENPG